MLNWARGRGVVEGHYFPNGFLIAKAASQEQEIPGLDVKFREMRPAVHCVISAAVWARGSQDLSLVQIQLGRIFGEGVLEHAELEDCRAGRWQVRARLA